jgi:glycosyltransferase involved in cell wall biosynthesis
MRKLKILNLALTDQGGAGIAARSFSDLLIASGHTSILIVKESTLEADNVIVLNGVEQRLSPQQFVSKAWSRATGMFRQPAKREFDGKYCFYQTSEASGSIPVERILAATPFKPDAIILHWVSTFITPEMIGELADRTQAKMLWLMMDNAPITGGCHYPWECLGYQSDCARCPAILTTSQQSLAERNLSAKKRHLPKEMGVLACSEVDFRRAMNSALFSERAVFKMLIPVDKDRYSPGDREAARTRFGVDPDAQVIFYGSIMLADRRKGGQLFLAALRRLQQIRGKRADPHRPLVVLVAGRAELGVFEGIDTPVRAVGYLGEEALIDAYRAADVFVSSSLEDSGPLMINQSVMCGTPVVSFEVGVALDLVHNGRTGYRARLGDIDEMAVGIAEVLALPCEEYRAMRARCRAIGLEQCDPHTQIIKLTRLLEQRQGVTA